jgi:hypothetical protein
MDYTISWDAAGFLEVKTSGKMNADDFIAMAKELLAHPKRLVDVNILFDHRALEFSQVSLEELQRIRAFHSANDVKIGSVKAAILVGAGLLPDWHKLWSQGEKIETRNIVRVFQGRPEAMGWLRINK